MAEKGTDPVEVVVPAGELAKGLNKIKEVVPKRGSLPIIHFVHVSGGGGASLILQGTNLEQAMRVVVPEAVFGEGPPFAAMLPLKPSMAFLNALVKDGKKGEKKDVKLTAADRKLALEVTDVGTLDWEDLPEAIDWPPPPSWDGKGQYVWCDGSVLMTGLRAVLPAVAKEDTRPTLTCLGVSNGGMVAADGFRLHVYENTEMNLGLSEQEDAVPALVPGATAAVLLRLYSPKEKIGVRFVVSGSSHKAWFEQGNTCVCTQLANGTYPNWRLLIPKEATSKVSFSAPLMMQRLEMLGDEVDIMRFASDAPAEGGAVLKMFATADGHKWNLTLPVQMGMEGQTKVAFNRRYVKDAVRPFALCEMATTTPSSPGVFTGDIKGLTIVVMPMFVQW